MNNFDVQSMMLGYLENNWERNEKWIQEYTWFEVTQFHWWRRQEIQMIGAEKHKSPYAKYLLLAL